MTAKPSIGLLMSMAIRHDHAIGCPGYYDNEFLGNGVSHARRLESTMRSMRQLWEEVTGNGFYSPEAEERYAEMAKACGVNASEVLPPPPVDG